MPSDVFQPGIFLINRKLIYTAKMGWPVMRVAALRKYGFSTGERGFVLTGTSGTSYFDDVYELLPDEEEEV